jgi:hypothetical protein
MNLRLKVEMWEASEPVAETTELRLALRLNKHAEVELMGRIWPGFWHRILTLDRDGRICFSEVYHKVLPLCRFPRICKEQ